MQQLPPKTSLQGGKYIIETILGQGGFGITYLATQRLLDRKVCIKEFFLKDSCTRTSSGEIDLGNAGNIGITERFLNKFIKEARTLSQLNHPNIIRILDIFIENNTAYYVMDFIEGDSLERIVNSGGPLAECVALDYIEQVAKALEYIHQHRINHLDVKPANIMIRRSDNKAILIDFGVSKQYDASGEQTSTTPVGISLGYAPIEQYQPGGVVTFSPQADIYSLGATLYKLVTGCTPPQAIDIFNDGMSNLPKSLSSNLTNTIQKAMQVKKDKRPQSIKDFLNSLNCNSHNPSPHVSSHPYEKAKIRADEVKQIKNEINGHEYVDLGLPSGVKWATCNIGANSPEESGDYFAWGELTTKDEYSYWNYNLSNNSQIKDISGNGKYDVACKQWGPPWRMPKTKDIQELIRKCTWKWETINGQKGYKIIGPNGNSIFLPACGYYKEKEITGVGKSGRYWTSTEGNSFIIHSTGHDISYIYHFCYGKNIRPVRS